METINEIFVAVDQSRDHYVLGIGFGGGIQRISSFPSKASPVTLNFSALSVHFTVARENTATIWCNGKRIDTFQRENLSGNASKFYIGRTGSTQPVNNNNNKEIAYLSIVRKCRMTDRDIRSFHAYLCKNYNIDHDEINL